MAYDTTEAVAKFLSGFQMKITNRERDTVAPDYYVKYSLTLSKGGKDFSTTFVSDPRASGEPTVTQVFSALADDALTLRKYSTDEFVDKLYAQGVKPSAALRAYDSLKETNLWMQVELYLSGWEIEEISKTLTKYGVEVNTLVEKAASERAARYAYDHPKLPKGFVTITQLQGDLDLGDSRVEVEDFDFDGDLTVAFSETADYKVDSNYHALLTWLPDHTEWLEQAEFDGLLEGCKGDIYKMVQMVQYEYIKSDLYDHREDICRYGTLDQLRDMGVYAIRESLADEILSDLSYDEDYAPTDDAKDTVMGAVSAAFKERYGEDFAEVATDFGQDIDDIAGRANPCILSVDTVRAVNERGCRRGRPQMRCNQCNPTCSPHTKCHESHVRPVPQTYRPDSLYRERSSRWQRRPRFPPIYGIWPSPASRNAPSPAPMSTRTAQVPFADTRSLSRPRWNRRASCPPFSQ